MYRSCSSNLEGSALHLAPLCGNGATKTWGLSWSGERKMQSVDAPRIHSSNFTSIQLFLSLEGKQGGRGITWKEQKDRELEENGFMSSPSRLPWTARMCPVKVLISSGNSGFLSRRGAEDRELAVERAVPAPSRQLKGVASTLPRMLFPRTPASHSLSGKDVSIARFCTGEKTTLTPSSTLKNLVLVPTRLERSRLYQHRRSLGRQLQFLVQPLSSARRQRAEPWHRPELPSLLLMLITIQ